MTLIQRYLQNIFGDFFTTFSKKLLFIIFAINFSIACVYTPKKGRLIYVNRESQSDIVYVTNLRKDNPVPGTDITLFVLPTGLEERKDIARDLDEIWADIANKKSWGVICPASSQGFPFEIPETGAFGLGGEHVIASVIRDARYRKLLPESSKGIFLIHLWGGGSAVLRIVELNPGVFEEVYLAPSATVDMESINNYATTKFAPKMWIILGNHGHKVVEEWYEEVERENTRVLRAPFAAPYKTLEGEKTMEEIGADYAELIVNLIDTK